MRREESDTSTTLVVNAEESGGVGPAFARRTTQFADHFDFPVRSTWNDFLGLALLIVISTVLIPFLVGAKVTVTVLIEFGATINCVTLTENGGLCAGPVTVTLNEPL